MNARPGGFRRHLTYANVMATLTLFLVLTGGAAYAATHLGKNSVGTKQLKKGSVSAAKLKANAVTSAKISKGAVAPAKIRPGNLEGADISPTVPFGHVIAAPRGHAAIAIPKDPGIVYPLENAGFTEEAGQAMFVVGGIEVEASPGCIGPRVDAEVIADQADPLKASEEEVGKEPEGIVAEFEWRPDEELHGPLKKLLTLSPSALNTSFFDVPAAPAAHSLAIVVSGRCHEGTGLSATYGGADVIGNKPN